LGEERNLAASVAFAIGSSRCLIQPTMNDVIWSTWVIPRSISHPSRLLGKSDETKRSWRQNFYVLFFEELFFFFLFKLKLPGLLSRSGRSIRGALVFSFCSKIGLFHFEDSSSWRHPIFFQFSSWRPPDTLHHALIVKSHTDLSSLFIQISIPIPDFFFGANVHPPKRKTTTPTSPIRSSCLVAPHRMC